MRRTHDPRLCVSVDKQTPPLGCRALSDSLPLRGAESTPRVGRAGRAQRDRPATLTAPGARSRRPSPSLAVACRRPCYFHVPSPGTGADPAADPRCYVAHLGRHPERVAAFAENRTPPCRFSPNRRKPRVSSRFSSVAITSSGAPMRPASRRALPTASRPAKRPARERRRALRPAERRPARGAGGLPTLFSARLELQCGSRGSLQLPIEMKPPSRGCPAFRSLAQTGSRTWSAKDLEVKSPSRGWSALRDEMQSGLRAPKKQMFECK
jgi:hypothetical protein